MSIYSDLYNKIYSIHCIDKNLIIVILPIIIVIFLIIIAILLIYKKKQLAKEYTNQLNDKFEKEKYKNSVQHYFENGLPLLLKYNIYGDSKDSTYNHEQGNNSIMEIRKLELKIISNIQDYQGKAFYRTSVIAVVAETGLNYVSESDVRGFVRLFIVDILAAANLSKNLNCFNKINLMNFRPDIWIITNNDSPLGVVMAKKPSVKGLSLVENPELITQVYDYMVSFEAFDGVYPHFAIVTTFTEWNIICFDNQISREVLFSSVSDNDYTKYEMNGLDHISKNDSDHDNVVTRKLIQTGSIAYDNPKLLQYLVSILVKCYNKRINGSIASTFIPLLQKNRIVLKLKEDNCSWIKIPNEIKKLSLIAPLFDQKFKNELFFLRDYKEGAEGKVWLGCTRQGQLVIMKIPIYTTKTSVDMVNDSIKAIKKECSIWNALYNNENRSLCTAKVITLNNHDVLLMPFVFCVHIDNANEKKFNTSMQPTISPNKDLLNADILQVQELQATNNHINECNVDQVAKSIIEKLAKNGMIHRDIHWRHIGVRPIFNSKSKKFDHFEPALIDLSSVEKTSDKSDQSIADSIRIMEEQLSKDMR